MLHDNQADVNAKNAKCTTSLFIACENGHKDISKILLNNQPDVNLQGAISDGATPLYMACQNSHKNIA